ncbi:adcA [Acrasis kona]|uniref:AdcA n=1 Tax=Acrasis kona TaxID=1008807 RepID=A0AAW2ZD48_9EUKA
MSEPQNYSSSPVVSPKSPQSSVLSSIKNAVNTVVRDMGKITIHIDRPSYIPGETVTGRAELVLKEEISARSMKVKWKGYEWTTATVVEEYYSGGKMHVRRRRIYDTRVLYKQTGIAHTYGANATTVSPGTYVYPFQFILPHNIPGSFYHDGLGFKGAIIYEIKFRVDMLGIDIKNVAVVQVQEICNKIPEMLHEENDKKFLFGGSGKLFLKVDVDKNIYEPGEHVVVNCSVRNDSLKDVERLKVKLMQDVKVKCQHEDESSVVEIHRMVYPFSVKAKSSFQGELIFEIPTEVLPSCTGIIASNQYHLDVECDVTMAFDLEVHPKITIVAPRGRTISNLYQDFNKNSWREQPDNHF